MTDADYQSAVADLLRSRHGLVRAYVVNGRSVTLEGHNGVVVSATSLKELRKKLSLLSSK